MLLDSLSPLSRVPNITKTHGFDRRNSYAPFLSYEICCLLSVPYCYYYYCLDVRSTLESPIADPVIILEALGLGVGESLTLELEWEFRCVMCVCDVAERSAMAVRLWYYVA